MPNSKSDIKKIPKLDLKQVSVNEICPISKQDLVKIPKMDSKRIPEPIIKKKPKSESKIYSIRLKSWVMEGLNQIKQEYNVKSTSKLIKQAIITWISMNPLNPDHPNPKLIISYNIFRKLIEDASEETLKQSAQISYQNGESDTNAAFDLASEDNKKYFAQIYTDVIERVKSVLKIVFSKEGQNWYNKHNYQSKENEFIFEGEHSLGLNFSKFVKFLFLEYFKRHNFQLTTEDYSQIQRTKINRKGEELKTQIYGTKFTFTRKE